jgi:hypothetical protein
VGLSICKEDIRTPMAFVRKQLKFTLRDIGSKVIDQLSSDIYSGPVSMIRELTKNAYDSYLAIDPDELDDKGISREIVISRERDANGMGRLLIADNGVGQSLGELKANVQISISKKPTELENATGFRGLGSWATLGAGSQIIITSSKKGQAKQSRLSIDVKKIYSKIGPNTTLDDILNDPQCIRFEEESDYDRDKHGTVVEIVCDGPTDRIEKYEFNRLYPYTDPANETLQEILIQSCPISFSSEGGAYDKIHQLYGQVGYIPTKVSLDGTELQKRLPPELTEFVTQEIKVAGRIAARTWAASNPKESREVTQLDNSEHAVGGPGIQLMKLNVPIGQKNIFSDGLPRAPQLRWYVGEIHIVLPDVLPDASGQGLRAGMARELFIEELRSFYVALGDQAEAKSERLGMERKLKKGMEAAKQLKSGKLSSKDQAHAESTIAKAVAVIEESSRTGKAATLGQKRLKEAAKHPDVKKIRLDARKLLQSEGHMARFAVTKPKGNGRRIANKEIPLTSSMNETTSAINLDEFQARLGRAVPRFSALGLSNDQIEKILGIINDLVIGEL